MISVLTTPEEFKNATVTIDFGFVLKENNVIIKVPFSKRCVFKLFSVHTHTKKMAFSYSIGLLKTIFEKALF